MEVEGGDQQFRYDDEQEYYSSDEGADPDSDSYNMGALPDSAGVQSNS